MSKRRLGLALSGGGTRGAAHLGVLQALEEEGIPIHCLAGTSVGALVAAAYALDGLSETVLKLLDRPEELRAFFGDRLRLAASNPLGRRVCDRMAAFRIEELRPRVAVCTVDVLTRDHLVLREGPLLPALQASIAIPFFTTPVAIRGRYLADPGRERFSALDAARGMGAEVVIEVLLYPRDQLEAPVVVERAVRPFLTALGWQLRPGAPGHRATVRFAVDLATRRKPRVPPADLVLAPDVLGIGMRSHRGARAAFRAGYAATRTHLSRLRELLAMPMATYAIP